MMINLNYIIEGLTLDITVLESLLRHNKNNHGRTLYFRRMSMALQSMNRHKVIEFGTQMKKIQFDYQQYQQNLKKLRRNEKKKKKLLEERWGEKILSQQDEEEETKKKKQETLLQNDFISLQVKLYEKFPEILSRIHHASIPLFVEINRGFFLPFCTVAIGALSRIRSLIQQIGCYGLTTLKEIVIQSQSESQSSLFKFSQQKFEIAMNQYYIEHKNINESSTKEDRRIIQKKQTQLTLSSLGIVTKQHDHDNILSSSSQQQPERNTTGAAESMDEEDAVASMNDEELGVNFAEEEMDFINDDDDDDERSNDSPLAQKKEIDRTSLNDDNDDDIGVSVGFIADASASLAVAAGANNNFSTTTTTTSNKKPVKTSLFDNTTATPIDRNLGLVQEFQKKKKKRKPDKIKNDHHNQTTATAAGGKKKEKKRKKSSGDSNHNDDDDDRKSSKKKKKKKKKTKGGGGVDYFDELFS